MDKDQLVASSVVAWIMINGFVNEYNKPLEFVKHRFLLDYMADDHPVIVTKKAAQIGMTVAESLKSFHMAAYGKKNVIHTLQTSDVIKGFVAPKVNPIIDYNQPIKDLMKTDSESLKQFGGNFVYYRGAQAESQAINITADVLLIDEYDRSNAKVVEIYQSRLDASEFKWRRYFSNPSAIGRGVDGLYEQSDQRHWFIKCSHCGHNTYIDFLPDEEFKCHYVNVDKSIYACGKCGGEIYDNDRINGEWVAKYPDRPWHGYWVSQLMCSWISAEHIIEKQATNSIEYFYNFVLGKAYSPTDLMVTRESILKATVPAIIPKTQVAIGVDVGVTKHWVAATPQGIFDYGSTESWDDIEKLLLMYNATMVIDAQPDITIPRRLVDKYKGRVFICFYKQDTKDLGTVRWQEGKNYGVVHADRTRIFDLIASEINNGVLKFRMQPGEMTEYIRHWGNTYRTVEIDAKGQERGVWVKDPSKPEHLAHATAYMRMALSRQLGGSLGTDFIEPLTSNVEKADYVDSQGKLHTNLHEKIEEAMEGTPTKDDWKYA